MFICAVFFLFLGDMMFFRVELLGEGKVGDGEVRMKYRNVVIFYGLNVFDAVQFLDGSEIKYSNIV